GEPLIPLGGAIADQVMECSLHVLEKFFFVCLEGVVPTQVLIHTPRLGMPQVSGASLRTTCTALAMALQAGIFAFRIVHLLAYLHELFFRHAQFRHIFGDRICRIGRQDEQPHTESYHQPSHARHSFYRARASLSTIHTIKAPSGLGAGSIVRSL